MILLIIITLLSTYIRLRYIHSITHSTSQSRRLGVSAVFLGGIMTTSVWATPKLIPLISPYLTTLTSQRGLSIGWSAIIVCASIIIRLLQRQRSWTHIITLSTIYMCGLAIITIPQMTRLIPTIVFGYVVLAEEYIKTQSAFARHQHTQHIISDALTYGLLSGLGFGIAENIWYIVGQYTTLGLIGTAQLIAMRSISSVMMHLVFSGIIMRLYIYSYKKIGHVPALICGYLIGVFIHLLYNLTMTRGVSRVLTLRLILGYGILSRFLYQSDSLYIKQALKSNKSS